ncbi:hypothetical protein IJ579_06235 [bacterium]|nr:hypothetical protein [bacterium]
MYEDLIRNNIIIELKKLVEKAEEAKSDIDSYSEFMRQMILNTYGVN